MKPFAHQTQAFERFKDAPYGALFMEQGTGKTKVIIDILSRHWLEGRITGVLVITTKSLINNWALTELPKHSPVKCLVYPWHTAKLEYMEMPEGHISYFIINIDAIKTTRFPAFFEKFHKLHKGKMAIVLDESTFIKGLSSKRTKICLQLAKYAKYRYIMSGTPVVQSPLDLWPQALFLDRQTPLLGSLSFRGFKTKYCVEILEHMGYRSFYKIVGYKNLNELQQNVNKFAFVIKKKDCLDLPEKIYKTIYVELTPEQKKAYREMKEVASTMVRNNEVTAANAAVVVDKCLQICAGQLKNGDGSYISLETNRLNALEEIMEEVEGKLIIWTHYVNTAFDISSLFSLRRQDLFLLSSNLTPDQREKVINEFREHKGKAVLLANPASAGHGLTLTEADTCIYYSRSWNYEHRIQSEDRIHRIGQTNKCLYIDLVAPGTQEEKLIKDLTKKKELGNTVVSSDELINYVKQLAEDEI